MTQDSKDLTHEIRKVLKLEHLGLYQYTLESLSKLKTLLPLLSSKDKNIHTTTSGDNTKIGEVVKKNKIITVSPQHDYPLRSPTIGGGLRVG